MHKYLVILLTFISCASLDKRNTLDLQEARECLSADGNVLRQKDSTCMKKLNGASYYGTLEKIEDIYGSIHAKVDIGGGIVIKIAYCKFDPSNKENIKNASKLKTDDSVVIKGDIARITYGYYSGEVRYFTMEKCVISRDMEAE